MSKRLHQNKYIREALEFAIDQGWTIVKGLDHCIPLSVALLTIFAKNQCGALRSIRKNTPRNWYDTSGSATASQDSKGEWT